MVFYSKLTECSYFKKQLKEHNEGIQHNQQDDEEMKGVAVKNDLHTTPPAVCVWGRGRDRERKLYTHVHVHLNVTNYLN